MISACKNVKRETYGPVLELADSSRIWILDRISMAHCTISKTTHLQELLARDMDPGASTSPTDPLPPEIEPVFQL